MGVVSLGNSKLFNVGLVEIVGWDCSHRSTLSSRTGWGGGLVESSPFVRMRLFSSGVFSRSSQSGWSASRIECGEHQVESVGAERLAPLKCVRQHGGTCTSAWHFFFHGIFFFRNFRGRSLAFIALCGFFLGLPILR